MPQTTFADLRTPSLHTIRQHILDERLQLITRPQEYLAFLEMVGVVVEMERVQAQARAQEISR